jgi:hypothetical protein
MKRRGVGAAVSDEDLEMLRSLRLEQGDGAVKDASARIADQRISRDDEARAGPLRNREPAAY